MINWNNVELYIRGLYSECVDQDEIDDMESNLADLVEICAIDASDELDE